MSDGPRPGTVEQARRPPARDGEPATQQPPPAPPWRRGRSLASVLLAPIGDGTRRRRGSDVLRLVGSVLTVLGCALLALFFPTGQRHVDQVLTSVPEGLQWLVDTLWWVVSVGVLVLLAALCVLALVRHRAYVARDLAVSGVGAWLICLVLAALFGSSGAIVHSPTTVASFGLPLARVAATVAGTTAALPYLSRGLQRTAEVAVGLLALVAVVHGVAYPLVVVASLAVGYGTTAIVHLAFGTPIGVESPAEVADLLADLGIVATDVARVARQEWGVAEFTALRSGERLDVSVYGRDAHDAQFFAKLFRFFAYRDSGPTLTISRIQQVEHEAFVSLMAARAGARVPDVIAARSAGPSNDAVLVTTPPAGRRLAEVLDGRPRPPASKPDGSSGQPASEVEAEPPPEPLLTDGGIAELYRQVLRLRTAGVAHGGLGPSAVVAGSDAETGLVGFRRATTGSSPERMDRDLAAALATAALASGPEAAVRASRGVVSSEELAAALPFLQRAALGQGLAKDLRGRKKLLTDLRTAGAAKAGVEVPALVEPRRVSWATFILVLGTIIGGWALIAVLVNVSQSWSTITGAAWGWVAATFVLAQMTAPSTTITTLSSVVNPLPFLRTMCLEISESFVALAGGSMAVLGTRVRYFQKQGYDATLAVSSGAVASTASWIVKGALFLVALPFAIGSLNLQQEPSGSGQKLVHVALLFFVVILVALGLVLLVPRLRRLATSTLRPKLSEVWAHLKVLGGRPAKLVGLFGGSAAAQLFVAFALGTALHAFDGHLNLAQLLVALTIASMLGGMSPVPGGMGVVEAGMILALTGFGIPEPQAVAAVFVQRLCTSYLPPIWGWFFLVWLRRRDFL